MVILKNYYFVVVPIFFMVWVALGWVVEMVFFAWLRRFTSRTNNQIDDIVIHAAKIPCLILIFVTGVIVAYNFLFPSFLIEKVGNLIPHLIKALVVLSSVIFIDQVLVGLVKSYALQHEFLKLAHNLLRGFAHIFVYGIGVLIIIDSLGISITPIIASLGIGSLAVALALQPTLENLFAGFQIILDQPVKQGQFVQLESGEEGVVEKVGWRSTWIRQLSNNTIVIPNSKLVNSRLLNYHYPSKDLAVIVEIGVHYESNLEKVERITTEVAEEIMKRVPGGVADFKPFIRFHKLDSSSVNFSVILRANEFGDSYLVRHEFIKALISRYTKEGIVIPFPIVALNTAQEQACFTTQARN